MGLSHRLRTVVGMSSDVESSDHETDIENLPTPGAMRWGHDWVPTLDGERIPIRHPYWFASREDAWAEAIKWVKLRAGLAFEIQLGSQTGCIPDEWSLIVETVAEAREAILRHVLTKQQDDEGGPGTRGHGRLGATWEDLVEYEDGRRYDPGNLKAGMSCSYSLSETGWVEGVGGVRWPVSDYRWAVAPPEVWDHPTDQPISEGSVPDFD